MNGPQRTACLAKGYIDSKFARCSAATNSEYENYKQQQMTSYHWLHPCQSEVADKILKHGRTDGTTERRTHGQYAILSLAGSQNLCQTIICLINQMYSNFLILGAGGGVL